MKTNNLCFSVTIFIGSFASFALEPMIGRTLLPVFGGTPSVWVTCLVAFQVMMVAGYWYAGKLNRRAHLWLLACAAVWCGVVFFFRSQILNAVSDLSGIPILDTFLGVVAICGLTFVLLSANSSLVQNLSGGNYRLYAVSNAGSLMGLMTYPLLIEPFSGLGFQWLGLGAFLMIYGLFLRRCYKESGHFKGTETPQVAIPFRIMWFLLPALSCALLNATTAHLTLDIAPMPLLWAVILAAFLASYIVGFSPAGEHHVKTWGLLASVLTLAVVVIDSPNAAGIRYWAALASCIMLVFAGAVFLHAWLYRLRPEPSGLTRFYLANVIGGACGGVLSGVVAPYVFKTVAEFPLTLLLVAFIVPLFVSWRSSRCFVFATGLMAIGTLAVLISDKFVATPGGFETVYRARGFFGTVKVDEVKARAGSSEGVVRRFVHGNTTHGVQIQLSGKERMATSYFTRYACGYAIEGHWKYKSDKPMRVNIIGLGVGVLFAYGREGDCYRAYDIAPEAIEVATNTNLFTFISSCPAKKEIVLADARKGLEAELASGVEPYDVIVVDAFTGDNIPYHLSTKEAFDLYFKLLKPDGILCFHTSNRHMNLDPLMRKVAEEYDVPLMGLISLSDDSVFRAAAKVAIFCREPSKIGEPPLQGDKARLIDYARIQPIHSLPTDEKGSLLELVHW